MKKISSAILLLLLFAVAACKKDAATNNIGSGNIVPNPVYDTLSKYVGRMVGNFDLYGNMRTIQRGGVVVDTTYPSSEQLRLRYFNDSTLVDSSYSASSGYYYHYLLCDFTRQTITFTFSYPIDLHFSRMDTIIYNYSTNKMQHNGFWLNYFPPTYFQESYQYQQP